MIKRILSNILALIFVLSGINVHAAKKVDCQVNETFDNYPLNDTSEFQKTITAAAGIDTRVTERSGTNKALYSRLWNGGVKFTVPVSDCKDKMVFSFDIMTSGDAVSGSALSLKGESPVFRFNSNGQVLLDDDKKITSLRKNVWKSFAVAVDFTAGTYDLYIDSKCVFENRFFCSTPKTITEFSFNFTTSEDNGDAGLYLDNIRVYEGIAPAAESDFANKPASNEVLEFEPTTEQPIYDKVFIESYGKQGISASLVEKEDTTAKWEKVDGVENEVIHFAKEGKNDVYADITTAMADTTSYVFQYDYRISPSSSDVTSNIVLYAPDGSTSSFIRVYYNGQLLVGNTGVCTLSYNTWYNIAVACDLLSGTASAYVNGELIKSGIPLIGGGSIATRFRIGYPSSSFTDFHEFYIGNFKLYEGKELRNFDNAPSKDEVSNEMPANGFNSDSILESSELIKTQLGYDTIFMTSNSKCFINKEKRDYSDFSASPYLDSNNVLMVPDELLATAMNMEYSRNDSSVSFGKYTMTAGSTAVLGASSSVSLDSSLVLKDGIYYIPAMSFCRDVLKKYVYWDDRGYLVISDENRAFKNDPDQNKETVDMIQRYMHYDRPSPQKIYNDIKSGDLYKVHPRFLATREEFLALRAKISTNSEYLNVYKNLINQSENYIAQPLTKYDKPDGLRLYGALATTAGGMIKTLGIAYQLTDDPKYAERAWQEIENILSWPDWNLDAHNLDSGAGVPAIVTGYDCIYNYLTPERKEHFKKRFQEMYIDYSIGCCNGTSKFNLLNSSYTYSNWGAVCGEGMLSAALCLIDEEDENSLLTQKCSFLASQIIQSLEYTFGLLYPSGTTKEGFVYWEYFFSSLTEILDRLVRICGDDYSLMSSPGFADSINFCLYGQDSNGAWPFSDTKMNLGVYFPDTTFLYARLTDDKELDGILNIFKNNVGQKSTISQVLWSDCSATNELNYPLDYYDKGQSMTFMKSSWQDPNAIFFGSLGGTNSKTMSHIDKGTFIFDALGERWFVDLGSDNYNLVAPGGYWGLNTRRNLYRIRTEGANCLVINPSADDFGQELDKTASVIRYESGDRGCISVLDLTEVYGTRTQKYHRGYMLTDDRDAAMIQDELTLSVPSDLYWFLHTEANIKIADDGKSAEFTQNGKKVRVEFYTDIPNWRLEVMKAESLSKLEVYEGEYSRDSIRKLAFVAEDASGNVTITAKLIPIDESVEQKSLEYKPISEWKVPDGALSKPRLTSLSINGMPLEGFASDIKKYTVNLPYGSKVPYFEAQSDNGTVHITQPSALTDNAVITVTTKDGSKTIYSIMFNLDINITNNLASTGISKGLPAGASLIKHSSVYADHEPQTEHLAACAVDGDFTTSWTSDQDGRYIELDFGSSVDFDGVAFSFLYGDTRQYSFEILVSDDKQNYTRLYSGKSSGETADYEVLPISGKARYLRLVGHFNSESNWNNVTELALWSQQ